MPKPRRNIRPTYLNLTIPEDLRAQLDLALWDEVELRVPHGRYAEYICTLIRNDLARVQAGSVHLAERQKAAAERAAQPQQWPFDQERKEG